MKENSVLLYSILLFSFNIYNIIQFNLMKENSVLLYSILLFSFNIYNIILN